MHKKLFIPGPTEVAPDVLQKLATPMIGHRSKDASNLQREISEKIRDFHSRYFYLTINILAEVFYEIFCLPFFNTYCFFQQTFSAG